MPPTPLTPIPALQKSPTEYLKLIDRHRPIIVKTHTPASLRSDCPPWHGMSGLVWRGLGGHFAVERVATLRGIRRHHHIYSQPALNIKRRPPTAGMPLHSFHQEVMIDVIEEPFDVKVKHPRTLPATISGNTHGMMCRAPWSVSIRIFMEYRLQQRLKPPPNNHLRNPVSYRGNSQRSGFAIPLGNVNPLDRRREVAARGHSIPYPVKILA